MDYRDETGEFGTYLNSLPSCDVSVENMVATFVVEDPPQDPAPPRETSPLENMGERIDSIIGSSFDKLVDEVEARGIIGRHRSYGTCWYKNLPQNEKVKNWFKAHMRVDFGVTCLNGKRKPSSGELKVFLCLPVSKRGKHPFISFQALFNKPKVKSREDIYECKDMYTPYEKLPFQLVVGTVHKCSKDDSMSLLPRVVSRWRKGWDPVGTGRLDLSLAGRFINKLVFGEFTLADQKESLVEWFSRSGVNIEVENWTVSSEQLAQARHDLGSWILRHLYLEPQVHTLHLTWEVCATCGGKGKHVNPSIDHNGITETEMTDLGLGFEEDYFGGVYDVSCYECRGRTTSLAVDYDRTSKETVECAEEWFDAERDYRSAVASERRLGA